jgi:integrase
VLKPSTQDRYRRTLDNHILPALGARRLCDIGTLDLQRFILQKADTGLSWACLDHYRHLLSKIFSTAKKWGYYSRENPAAGVELPEKKAVREKHVLTPEQISQLSGVLREPVRTMFLLAILTGLRIGEILGLRGKDLDLDSGELRVEQACYRGHLGSPKTQGSKRCLPLPSGLVEVLVQYRLRCLRIGPDDLFFPDGHGQDSERHQSAASAPEARRSTDGSTQAELAYAETHARHAVAIGGWVSKRCPGTTRALQTLNHPRGLHRCHPVSAEGGSRKTLPGFVDEC